MLNPFGEQIGVGLTSKVKAARATRPSIPNPLRQLRVRSAGAGYRKKLRGEALAAYGSKCTCCAERRPAFLIFLYTEDGQSVNGQKPLKELKMRGWPKDAVRLSCFNCHLGARIAGVCPHQLDARHPEKSSRLPAESEAGSPPGVKEQHHADQL